MPVFCEISINESFKKEFLENLAKDWNIDGSYSNKRELVQVLNGSFGTDVKPHVRIYLVQHEDSVYGVTGKKPEANPQHEPKGLVSFLNKFKQEPNSIKQYVNRTLDLVTDDQLVNSRVQKIVSGELTPGNLLLLLKDWPASPPENSEELETGDSAEPKFDPSGTNNDSRGTVNNPNGTNTGSCGTRNDPYGTNTESCGIENNPNGTNTGSCGTRNDPQGTRTESQGTENDPYGTKIEPYGAKKDISCHFVDKSTHPHGFTKLIKIETFDRERISAEEWLDNAAYSFDLGGFRDSRSYLPCILSKLPDDLQYQTRNELSRLGLPPEKVTFQDIKKVLMELTKCSRIELDRKLSNIKYESNMKLRKLWLSIERIVKLMNPAITDHAALDLITSREFRAKLPEQIRQNVSFKASPLTNIDLTDLAETVRECSVINVTSNALTKGKDKGRGKGSGRGGFRGGRGGYRGERNDRKKDEKEDSSRKSVGPCWCCGKMGHVMSDCRILQARKRESKSKRSGRDADSKSEDA